MVKENAGLEDWLSYISQLHPATIELGLERLRQVQQRMPPLGQARIVTVAGTNGKGSTVAMLASALQQSGFKVGAYTSPHILRFNERIRILGHDVEDAALVQAFVQIEALRQDIPLTYFEFTTLAALLLLAQAELDVLVLEVGLGGRLDAVNIVDADIAIITSIGLDHMAWLGDTVEAIGREKAGILRTAKTALLGRQMPQSVYAEASRIGAPGMRVDQDFGIRQGSLTLKYLDQLVTFPLPLTSRLPDNNIALALQAFACVVAHSEWSLEQFSAHLQKLLPVILSLPIPGRLEQVCQCPEVILDVGHNPHAAAFLATWLASRKKIDQRCIAVFSALDDKDVGGVVAAMADHVDVWYLASLNCDRAMALDRLQQQVQSQSGNVLSFADLETALAEALAQATLDHSLVLVFGSFYVVEQAKIILGAKQP